MGIAASVLDGRCEGRFSLAPAAPAQNFSFSPICSTRALPEPIRLLPAATSGGPPAAPNVPGTEGSIPLSQAAEAPYGLANSGGLSTLKTSTRTWALHR